MDEHTPSVVVLYNFVGEDVYEKIRNVDPASLAFQPEYDIHVSTVTEEYKAVTQALRKEGLRARTMNVKEDLKRLENYLRRKNRADVIFNLVEYFHDDPEFEPHVAALFELHKVPYTGASPLALALCQKKGLTKQVLTTSGVPTPRYVIAHDVEAPEHDLAYPLIVKPAREDASSGVSRHSVVHNRGELAAQLVRIETEHDPPFLVEEFIQGRELHVSLLGNDPPEVLPPIEFDFSNLPEGYPPIISYAAKWDPLQEVYHRVHAICPADLTERAMEKVEDVAARAYAATGCRDYARLDIRLTHEDIPYVLEVNPNPDLTEGVSFMESAEEAGYGWSETLRLIVEWAWERRWEEEPADETPPPPELHLPSEAMTSDGPRSPDG
jgi:D-alanine-D-alanine ligase